MSKGGQTNGICERFHKTILQEFYQITFRTNVYTELNAYCFLPEHYLTLYVMRLEETVGFNFVIGEAKI